MMCKIGGSLPPGVGTIMGSYMIRKIHRNCWNQGDGHDDGVELHVMDFAHVLNMYVPTIFCVLWYIFLLNVTKYAFFFLAASTFGLHSRPSPKVWARGMGMLTLCGPSGGMWTQVGGEMIWGVMSGRGVIYVNREVGPRNQN